MTEETPPVIITPDELDPAYRPIREISMFYDETLASRILDHYLQGASLHRISKMEGMPSYGTILKWLQKNSAFEKDYYAAKRIRAVHLEELAMQAVGLEDEAYLHKDDVPSARLKFDAAMRFAEVSDAERYGKRTTIQGDASKPIVFQVTSHIPPAEVARDAGEARPVLEAEKRVILEAAEVEEEVQRPVMPEDWPVDV